MLVKLLKNQDITEEEAMLLTSDEVKELIRSDPVTCMRHFDHRYRALINTLFKKEQGIFHPYECQDYFNRLEFQMRGSPHLHGMYWIKDAPIYQEGDDQSERDCIEFIDKFITCERCEEGKMAKYLAYQLHKHVKRTCAKKGRTCRFGFPKPPMEETRILHPLPNDFDPVLKKKYKDIYVKFEEKLNEFGRDFKEDIPRNEIDGPDDGSPEPLVIVKPATLPLIRSEASLIAPLVISFSFILAIALVTLAFF